MIKQPVTGLRFGSGAAPHGDRHDLDHAHAPAQRQHQHIANAHSGAGAFDATPVEPDMPRTGPFLRQAARSGEPEEPQQFVDADARRRCRGDHQRSNPASAAKAPVTIGAVSTPGVAGVARGACQSHNGGAIGPIAPSGKGRGMVTRNPPARSKAA